MYSRVMSISFCNSLMFLSLVKLWFSTTLVFPSAVQSLSLPCAADYCCLGLKFCSYLNWVSTCFFRIFLIFQQNVKLSPHPWTGLQLSSTRCYLQIKETLPILLSESLLKLLYGIGPEKALVEPHLICVSNDETLIPMLRK